MIDGHKMWIGNGGIANVHVVNATVDPELGHRGQALFIVPGGTPGLELVRKLDKLGCRASHTAELQFDGVRIPGDHLLGGDEKLEAGLQRARESGNGDRGSATLGAFEQTRPMVAAQALGIARAALEFAVAYATEREAFGGPIIDKQGISFPLADLAADLDAARLLTWRAAWMAANRVPFQHGEGSMSKLQRLRGGAARDGAGDPGLRRLGLHLRPAGGEVVPRRQALHDLRGHERDPADGDRPRARRGRRRAAAAPRLPVRRPAAQPPARARDRGASRAGMAALKQTKRVPEPLLRAAMKVLGPPERAPRR